MKKSDISKTDAVKKPRMVVETEKHITGVKPGTEHRFSNAKIKPFRIKKVYHSKNYADEI